MIPITPDIRLHHFPAHHMTIITAITLEKGFLLPCNWGVTCLIEPFFDQVNYRLTLLLGQDGFWETGVEETCHSHWVMRLLVIGREKSA